MKSIRLPIIIALLGITACGGAAEPPAESAQPLLAEDFEPAPPPPAPRQEVAPKQAPVQRIAPVDDRKCATFDQEDGTQMVISSENDWFFYMPSSAKVECGSFGGNVTVTDGPLEITIKPLVPQGTTGTEAEKMLREQAVGFVRSALQTRYGSGSALQFEETKLGKLKRPALCADADLEMKGLAGRVVVCITSKTNANDDVIVHRVVWVDETSAYDATTVPKRVKEAAANWMRHSDTDGFGKILNKW